MYYSFPVAINDMCDKLGEEEKKFKRLNLGKERSVSHAELNLINGYIKAVTTFLNGTLAYGDGSKNPIEKSLLDAIALSYTGYDNQLATTHFKDGDVNREVVGLRDKVTNFMKQYEQLSEAIRRGTVLAGDVYRHHTKTRNITPGSNFN